jgi:hypothetical protein
LLFQCAAHTGVPSHDHFMEGSGKSSVGDKLFSLTWNLDATMKSSMRPASSPLTDYKEQEWLQQKSIDKRMGKPEGDEREQRQVKLKPQTNSFLESLFYRASHFGLQVPSKAVYFLIRARILFCYFRLPYKPQSSILSNDYSLSDER